MGLTFYVSTGQEGISGKTGEAATHWNMAYHLTLGVLAASAWARINAFVSHTSLTLLTIVTQYTFRPTTHVWVSTVFGQTCTDTVIALCIGATWTWVASVNHRRLWGC